MIMINILLLKNLTLENVNARLDLTSKFSKQK